MAFSLLMKSQNTATEKKSHHGNFHTRVSALTLLLYPEYGSTSGTAIHLWLTVKAKTTLLTSFWSKEVTGYPHPPEKLHLSKVKQEDASRYFISEFIICENNELTLSERTGGISQILGKPSKTSLLKQLSQLMSSDWQSCYTQLDSSIIKTQDREKNKTSIAVFHETYKRQLFRHYNDL